MRDAEATERFQSFENTLAGFAAGRGGTLFKTSGISPEQFNNGLSVVGKLIIDLVLNPLINSIENQSKKTDLATQIHGADEVDNVFVDFKLNDRLVRFHARNVDFDKKAPEQFEVRITSELPSTNPFRVVIVPLTGSSKFPGSGTPYARISGPLRLLMPRGIVRIFDAEVGHWNRFYSFESGNFSIKSNNEVFGRKLWENNDFRDRFQSLSRVKHAVIGISDWKLERHVQVVELVICTSIRETRDLLCALEVIEACLNFLDGMQ